MKYVSIPTFTKTEMETIIAQDDIEQLIYVPLFASMYYEDRDFAKQICLKLAVHPNFKVRAFAIEGFGHIARIDGVLAKEIIKPLIEQALIDNDEFVRMKAMDTKDDLKHFLKWKFKK